jgi:hypothetical protein
MNSTTLDLLRELHAMVMGECPSLLNEDSGGNGQLAIEIEEALSQRTEQQVNPWRQAVDEALIAHALDCTGPGDDPKEKVKELIEWAVTIATDPRVSETAEREQGASATGAEPAFYISRKQLPLLGKTPAPYVAYRMAPEGNFDTAVYLATPTTSTTGKVDASRVRSADYEAVLADHRRLVRELDVILNGHEGAAEQASLCDIVSQLRRGSMTPGYLPHEEGTT